MRHPSIGARFDHVVLIDPPPFAHLERLASAGAGFLHLAWGEAEIELALRVHEEEWPHHPALVALFRSLRAAAQDGPPGGGQLIPARVRELLHGPGRHPRSPEVAARRLRVLEELGAVRWQPFATARALRVVSSVGKDVQQAKSFVAYRERYEEGRRFLS